jgi:hypothetical protein
MLKKTGLTLAAGLLAVSAFAANIQSGLKPGADLPAFQVADITGPNKGRQLCYRCQFGGNPVMAAFIKGSPTEAAPLLAAMQGVYDANKAKNLKSFVVFMGGPELAPAVKKLAAEKGISIPLTVLPQGTKAADVAQYQINPEAANTILLWNKGEVHSNFVNVKPAEIDSVGKAAADMLK